MARRAVFLDRDGTINIERSYVRSPEDFEFVPGLAPALLELSRAGFALVVVTNQSGVARGYLDRPMLDRIHAKMTSGLAAEGVALQGIYLCAHHPEADCDCRKPRPGLIRAAAKDLDLDVGGSYVVGDRWSDLQLAIEAGCKGSVLIENARFAPEAQALGVKVAPTYAAQDIAQAARWIISRLR